MTQAALQDLVDGICYGCGRLNDKGLQIKTYPKGDEYLCDWRPQPQHVGHPGNLHLGVAATIVFCNGAWAANAESHRREGREIRNPPEFFYVNRALKFDVLGAIPLESEVTFRASVVRMEGKNATVQTSVWADGKERVRAETQLMRVTPEEVTF